MLLHNVESWKDGGRGGGGGGEEGGGEGGGEGRKKVHFFLFLLVIYCIYCSQASLHISGETRKNDLSSLYASYVCFAWPRGAVLSSV